jgi:Poly(ADP-ribose) polymerase catalytic domain
MAAVPVLFSHGPALPFTDEEFGDAELPDYDEDADDDFYIPTWMGRSHGFIDFGRRQEEDVLALIEKHLPSDVAEWDYRDGESWRFRYPEVEISLATSSDSPSFFLPVEVVNRNYTLERTVVDPLRLDLRNLIAQEGPRLTCFYEFALLILRTLEETSACLRSWRGEEIGKAPEWQPWNPRQVRSWLDVLDNPVGVDLTSIKDTAHYILGKTPEQICAKLPKKVRVLHVESVLRNDLAARFFDCRAEMRQTLRGRSKAELARSIPHDALSQMKGHEEMVDYLTTPRLTFHGTGRRVIHSIVRYGFTKPGARIGDTDEKLSVRCGSTYGLGIYSSPSPDFSLSYSGYWAAATRKDEIASMKLIVCGVLMGRTAGLTREDNWRNHSEAVPQADSHVANSEYEYIVFDEAQIVPCYVIHLDWGAAAARLFLERIPEDSETWVQQQQQKRKKKNKTHPRLVPKILYAGDVEHEKAAKQAAAAKWFPYGYGPAKGTRFVIEEIGETSDDEENYGEYQDAKIAEVTRKRDASLAHQKQNYETKLGRASIFDEFFEAAKTDRKVLLVKEDD